MAEIIHHFIPKIIEIHNYVPTSNLYTKEYNWITLNKK